MSEPTFRYQSETVPLVGIAEIAGLLEVAPATVHTWRHRRLMPEPYTLVSDRPAWLESVLLGWAESTGRLPECKTASPPHPNGMEGSL